MHLHMAPKNCMKILLEIEIEMMNNCVYVRKLDKNAFRPDSISAKRFFVTCCCCAANDRNTSAINSMKNSTEMPHYITILMLCKYFVVIIFHFLWL